MMDSLGTAVKSAMVTKQNKQTKKNLVKEAVQIVLFQMVIWCNNLCHLVFTTSV